MKVSSVLSCANSINAKQIKSINTNNNINFQKNSYHWIDVENAMKECDNATLEEICKNAPWEIQTAFYLGDAENYEGNSRDYDDCYYKNWDSDSIKFVCKMLPDKMKSFAFSNLGDRKNEDENNSIIHRLARRNVDALSAFCESFPEESLQALTRENKNGQTPISLACIYNADSLKYLIEKYPDTVKKALTKQNEYGYTPVHSLGFFDSECTQVLVDNYPKEVKKALKIKTNNGNTAFHKLCTAPKSMEILIDEFPNEARKALLIQNKNGETPVHTAAGHYETLKLFYDKFPSEVVKTLDIKENKYHHTPINCACSPFKVYESIRLFHKIAPDKTAEAVGKSNQVYAYLMPTSPNLNYYYRHW